MHFKKMIALFLILICHFSYASEEASDESSHTVMSCLRAEEINIHKQKIAGPIYELNRTLINSLLIFNNVPIKEKYAKKICDSKEFSPSVNFLQFLLLKGKVLFHYQNTENQAQGYLDRVFIEDFLKDLPLIFVQYLSALQNLTPTHDCLEKHIPEINIMLMEFQYLGTDFSFESLLKREIPQKIFAQLKNFDAISSSCQKKKSKTKKSI